MNATIPSEIPIKNFFSDSSRKFFWVSSKSSQRAFLMDFHAVPSMNSSWDSCRSSLFDYSKCSFSWNHEGISLTGITLGDQPGIPQWFLLVFALILHFWIVLPWILSGISPILFYFSENFQKVLSGICANSPVESSGIILEFSGISLGIPADFSIPPESSPTNYFGDFS